MDWETSAVLHELQMARTWLLTAYQHLMGVKTIDVDVAERARLLLAHLEGDVTRLRELVPPKQEHRQASGDGDFEQIVFPGQRPREMMLRQLQEAERTSYGRSGALLELSLEALLDIRDRLAWHRKR